MALKLGGMPTPPPEEMAMPPEEAAPPAMPPEPLPMEPLSDSAMVDQQIARYLGPEARCMSCVHFFEPGSCEIVMGKIDPQGVCSLYVADGPEEGAMTPSPAAMPPAGMPAEPLI